LGKAISSLGLETKRIKAKISGVVVIVEASTECTIRIIDDLDT
jgi:hypothetical protein